MLDPRFLPHNAHLEDPAIFAELDPQLRWLKHQRYVFHSPLLQQFPTKTPGIYTLGGGRQIGKSTLLKQWMLQLIKNSVNPKSIMFVSGELIPDNHALYALLAQILEVMPENSINYILIDEVTYIHEWDKAIKFAADAGLLEHTILMLTGSDLSLIQEARMRFPGRRGKSDIVNFHLYPLSFREFFQLKHPKIENPNQENIELLYEEFNFYLWHGGFLTAINEFAIENSISNSTLNIYAEWIRGDMIKRGKKEHFLKEIIASIIKRYNTQVTWNSLAKDLSIDHPHTVADYSTQLESMDTLYIQGALLEDKLTMAPKKAKKIVFNDPFIFHALRAWIWLDKDPFKNQIQASTKDPEMSSKLVEACVTTHYHRYFSTYYIKGDSEVDIAYIEKERFWPIEIKWTNQFRSQDLKQIRKYPNGRIFAKIKQPSKLELIPVEPLPLALIDIHGNHLEVRD